MGCVLFGMVWAAERRYAHLGRAYTVVLVGCLGGLATFSSLIFDTSQLFTDQRWLVGLGGVALQLVLGMASRHLGMYLVERLA